jgi:hypothetical protein
MRQIQYPPNIDDFNKSIPILIFIHHPNKVLCYNEEYNRGQGTRDIPGEDLLEGLKN